MQRGLATKIETLKHTNIQILIYMDCEIWHMVFRGSFELILIDQIKYLTLNSFNIYI